MATDVYGNWVSSVTQAPIGDLPDSIIGGGGGGGGVEQVYSGSFANPNGNVVPDDTDLSALYTQEGSGNTVLWRWDTSLQNWQQITG